jgi:hypothetical protein
MVMSEAPRNLESIARALAAGFCFGPRVRCAACNQTSEDADAINRGICDRCHEAIEAHQKAPTEKGD